MSEGFTAGTDDGERRGGKKVENEVEGFWGQGEGGGIVGVGDW